jgi:uncharacterized membrane protein YgcG
MRCRFSSCSLLIVLLTAVSLHAQQVMIPPIPELNGVGKFVHDKSGLLMPAPLEMRRRVFRAQKVAFEDHRTPIILVTIHHMAAFGYEEEEIQPFAEQWFNEWDIGTEKTTGENRGILFLISVQDRKARIELGKDWGRRWDGHCQRIMNRVILPHFRNDNYSIGIIEGIEELSAMAQLEPDGTIPRTHWYELPLDFVNTYFGESRVGIFSWSLFPMPLIFIFLVIGVINVIYGVAKDEKAALICGLAICGLAILTYVAIGLSIVYAFIFHRDMFGSRTPRYGVAGEGSGGWGGGGGGYSGGGFSGGSSGGGGASGSW